MGYLFHAVMVIGACIVHIVVALFLFMLALSVDGGSGRANLVFLMIPLILAAVAYAIAMRKFLTAWSVRIEVMSVRLGQLRTTARDLEQRLSELREDVNSRHDIPPAKPGSEPSD